MNFSAHMGQYGGKMGVNITYPQNYIFRKPLNGSLILLGFSIFFLLFYKPLNVNRSMLLDFEWTIVAYSFVAAVAAFITTWIIRKIPYFSDQHRWTLLKELLAAYIVIQVIGIAIFLSGFVLEESAEASRWNFATFLDSCFNAFLIEVFPFGFFTIMNFNKRLKPKEEINYQHENTEDIDEVVHIKSTLKKESLSFYSRDFLFAEADGNYVVFHLLKDNQTRKSTIRNSISAIDKQLTERPDFFRCHRAFIVNLDKVISKRGNSLGYTLSLEGTDENVPVSRSNVEAFDEFLKR